MAVLEPILLIGQLTLISVEAVNKSLGKVKAAPAVKPQQPYSLTDVAKGGYLRSGMKGVVVRDMQELIKNNFPEIEIDLNGVFNQQTLDAVIKVQKMLGVKPKNGKYGIFGPITIGAINKSKTSRTTQPPKLDPKTGLPDNSLGLPKFDTSVDRFNKFGISKEKQDADLKKLGLKENMKLTDIVNGMVQEQNVIPGVGIDRGNGYY